MTRSCAKIMPKKQIPLNAHDDGEIAPCLTAHYHKAGGGDFRPDVPCKHLAILEIMEEPQIKQIGSYSPSSACNAKVLDPDGICPTLLNHKGAEPAILTQRRTEEGRELRKQGVEAFKYKELVPREDGMSNTLTSVQHDNLLLESSGLYVGQSERCFRGILPGLSRCVTTQQQNAVLYPNQVIGSNQANAQYVAEQNKTKTTMYRIRKLTPTECYRLQGVDDSDIEKMRAYPWKSYEERENALSGLSEKERKRELRKGISKSKHYCLAGNSITVDVLYHIFRTMFIPNQPENAAQSTQLTLFD